MLATSLPFVSAVIPARNEARRSGACLLALEIQTYPAERPEFVVAVGPSQDETARLAAAAAERNPRITVVHAPSGTTPEALNLAIAAARGDVICRMDAHAVPSPMYVERCVKVLDSSNAWCVGGRMNKVGSSPIQQAIAQAMSSRFGIGDSSFHYADQPRSVESVYLGCWPRWVFDQVGAFDEELLRNQDDELSFRIRQAGGVIWFDPSIQVEYHPRDSLTGVFDQHRQYGLWKIRVFQKHPRAVRWRHLVPGALVLALALPMVAPRSRTARRIGLMAGGSYVVAATAAAWTIHRAMPTVAVYHLVEAFGAMHLGYGVGLWQGLLTAMRRGRATQVGKRVLIKRQPPEVTGPA